MSRVGDGAGTRCSTLTNLLLDQSVEGLLWNEERRRQAVRVLDDPSDVAAKEGRGCRCQKCRRGVDQWSAAAIRRASGGMCDGDPSYASVMPSRASIACSESWNTSWKTWAMAATPDMAVWWSEIVQCGVAWRGGLSCLVWSNVVLGGLVTLVMSFGLPYRRPGLCGLRVSHGTPAQTWRSRPVLSV